MAGRELPRAPSAPGWWVRISELAGDPQWAELLATAITDLAMAQALVMIHGQERGLARYLAGGGRVRFDADGEPVIQRRSLDPAPR
jgi:hypothetical protein